MADNCLQIMERQVIKRKGGLFKGALAQVSRPWRWSAARLGLGGGTAPILQDRHSGSSESAERLWRAYLAWPMFIWPPGDFEKRQTTPILLVGKRSFQATPTLSQPKTGTQLQNKGLSLD